MTFIIGAIILAGLGVAVAVWLASGREKSAEDEQALRYRLQEAKRAEVAAALARQVRRDQTEGLGTLHCHVRDQRYTRGWQR